MHECYCVCIYACICVWYACMHEYICTYKYVETKDISLVECESTYIAGPEPGPWISDGWDLTAGHWFSEFTSNPRLILFHFNSHCGQTDLLFTSPDTIFCDAVSSLENCSLGYIAGN